MGYSQLLVWYDRYQTHTSSKLLVHDTMMEYKRNEYDPFRGNYEDNTTRDDG